MSAVQIFGLIVAAICIVCGTILIYKSMEIKAIRDQNERAAIIEKNNKIIHDEYRLAYEDEYAKRIDEEFRHSITKRELKRARELLSKVKLSEVN